MPSTDLPIRVFAQRSIDEERTEPGGGAEPPKWLLQGQELLDRSQRLSVGLQDCLDDQRHNQSMPYVFQAVLGHDGERDASAKSKRKAVVDMFQVSRSPNVIGMKGSETLVVTAESEDEMHAILGHLEDVERYSYALSCVMDIARFAPDVQTAGSSERYKIRLLDRQNPAINAEFNERFEKVMEKLELAFDRIEYSAKLSFYSTEASEHQIRAIADGEFAEGLFSITPMPRYRATLDFIPCDGQPDIEPPVDDGAYPVLGILDSGIEPLPELAPWLVGGRWSPYPSSGLDPKHGTFVAGVALCGDRLQHCPWVGHKGVMLYDAAVFPDGSKEPLYEDDLISNIREAVESAHGEINVWNLSISISRPIADESFSDLAIALDAIQDQYGILICKSAGNTAKFLSHADKDRIYAGADSMRALTVGSVAHDKGPSDLVDIGYPSPFSCVGPGPEYTIKPEVSHFGGNAGIDSNGEPSTTGVISLNCQGGLAKAVGTSFSTPRIASLASSLQFALNDPFNPLLVKTLIMHSATCPSDAFIPDDERVKEMGFGVPGNIQDILFDDRSRATLILRGSLAKGEIIDIKDFPMPQSLIKEGHYTGQIVVTVAFNPLLDASQGGEYCQSDIDVLLGTYSEKFEKDISKPNILNSIGRKDSQNLLRQSLYSKRIMKDAKGDFALRERLLVQYQGKYCPVKKYAVDLSELTDANREYTESDRHWYLHVNGLFRENTERKAVEANILPHQEYCVIVSIIDPEGKAPIYDDVAKGLTAHSFMHSSINLSSDVRVMLGQ